MNDAHLFFSGFLGAIVGVMVATVTSTFIILPECDVAELYVNGTVAEYAASVAIVDRCEGREYLAILNFIIFPLVFFFVSFYLALVIPELLEKLKKTD